MPSTRLWCDLRGDRPAIAFEAVEQRHLPQRVRAVEAVGVEIAEPLEKLGLVRPAPAASHGACGSRCRSPGPAPSSARRTCRPAAMRGDEESGAAARAASPVRARDALDDGVPPSGSGSKTIAQPMCMWADSSPSSSSRNAASNGVRRSPMHPTVRLPGGCRYPGNIRIANTPSGYCVALPYLALGAAIRLLAWFGNRQEGGDGALGRVGDLLRGRHSLGVQLPANQETVEEGDDQVRQGVGVDLQRTDLRRKRRGWSRRSCGGSRRRSPLISARRPSERGTCAQASRQAATSERFASSVSSTPAVLRCRRSSGVAGPGSAASATSGFSQRWNASRDGDVEKALLGAEVVADRGQVGAGGRDQVSGRRPCVALLLQAGDRRLQQTLSVTAITFCRHHERYFTPV